MYKQILESLNYFAPFAVGALIVFITFFILLTIWTSKRSKSYLNHMEELPLHDTMNAGYEREVIHK